VPKEEEEVSQTEGRVLRQGNSMCKAALKSKEASEVEHRAPGTGRGKGWGRGGGAQQTGPVHTD
jgi:hypothetical protein